MISNQGRWFRWIKPSSKSWSDLTNAIHNLKVFSDIDTRIFCYEYNRCWLQCQKIIFHCRKCNDWIKKIMHGWINKNDWVITNFLGKTPAHETFAFIAASVWNDQIKLGICRWQDTYNSSGPIRWTAFDSQDNQISQRSNSKCDNSQTPDFTLSPRGLSWTLYLYTTSNVRELPL